MGYFRKKNILQTDLWEKNSSMNIYKYENSLLKVYFLWILCKKLTENSLQTVLSWLHFKTERALCRVENLFEVIEVNFPC